MRRAHFAVVLGFAALAGTAGCTGKTTVAGTVTYEGKKLDRGYVTFYPVNDVGDTRGVTGDTRGAEIIDGSYTANDLTPGKRKAVISVPPQFAKQKSSDKAPGEIKVLPPAFPISPGTRGNSQIVEITNDNLTLNFALLKK
jgi:hypothetical protein